MGMDVRGAQTRGDERRNFMKGLLRDVRALEQMLDQGHIESGVRRIGAEQELFLVNGSFHAAPKALELLDALGHDPMFSTELGLFNLEFSVDPILFGQGCLREMEASINHYLRLSREAAAKCNAHVVMTGILPSIEKSDLGLHNQTPNPRYRLLNDTLSGLRGDSYEINIKGADEILVRHDSVMLESANTSFQVHFQVGPEEFVKLYNVAQAVTAPVLAAATNSPLLFGKRLWRETRIALFQQSVDTRASKHYVREAPPRVSFGSRWVDDSVLDIFREDIARFRVLFSAENPEDALERLARGEVPGLDALRMHNSTIYRWNRPCYGISEGKPHLRIENRVLPAGPTVIDEVANAAFWFGLMSSVTEEFDDVRERMDFDDARANFMSAARAGLEAPITWFDGKTRPAHQLIDEVLLPMAREGLSRSGMESDEIGRYLDIIERRVRTRQTGSEWMLRSFTGLRRDNSPAETLTTLVAATIERQEEGAPVHTWTLATNTERTSWRDNHMRVGQYMSRDLFTLDQDEPIEFAASLMTWHHVHWVPVEDKDHHLVGLITHDVLLKLFADPRREEISRDFNVSDLMLTDVPSIGPDTSTLEAIRLMTAKRLPCLPVVEQGKLVGMVTERDVMKIAVQLLNERLSNAEGGDEEE